MPTKTTKTPYPPGRVCPMCGHTVGRHDTMLYCHPECDQNELARYDMRAQKMPSEIQTTIYQPSRQELLEMAIVELGKPVPSTKGMDPKAVALRLHAELSRRIHLAEMVRLKGVICDV